MSSQEDFVNRRMEYPGYYQSIGQSMAASVYDRAAGAMTSRNDRYTIQFFHSGLLLAFIEKSPVSCRSCGQNQAGRAGHVVGFVLHQDNMGNRFHDHELTEIINPDWLAPGRDTSREALGHRTNQGHGINILCDNLGVNGCYGEYVFPSVE